MSEIKLNLIDSQTILAGTIHASIGDRCVAALSAEPETIHELEAALVRFEKDLPSFYAFPMFSDTSRPDTEPYDAGILIIDLASRIVACDSTYSMPGPEGTVNYHNGNEATDIPIFYRVPSDWLFLYSIEEYEGICNQRRNQRLSNPPLDARAILYGRPLLEFLATNIRYVSSCHEPETHETSTTDTAGLSPVAAIHAQWLLTPRHDLGGQSPREVMLAKQDFIDCELHSRSMQWSIQLEGPPCLAQNSYAYRFAGFGTHEWVIYYGLVRHLLERAVKPWSSGQQDFEELITHLDSLKNTWLNEPNMDLDQRIPAIIIDNERKRLPEAMGGRSMVVDEDCPLCKMMGDECEAGLEVCFWHLDGCNMDEHFAFSTFLTEKEYLEDMVENELRHREFDRKWKEREERIARGEPVEPDPFLDLPALDEFVPFSLAEPEPPEA
jgi:hypothetical protein